MIQRREPLTSTPTNSVASISTIETMSTISAVRRAWRGVRKEVAIITDQRRQEEGDVALDEMEAVIAEPLGDRRARRPATG